ncbi:MAG: hypothetical protein Kow00109_06990 [Acidobacteriota bacterium]
MLFQETIAARQGGFLRRWSANWSPLLADGPRRGQERRGEKGSALVVALIFSLLLLAVALALTSSSIVETQLSDEFEKHHVALTLAEAGLGVVRADLKGEDLQELTDRVVEVPDFLGIPAPSPGSYAARNPLPLEEARRIDFANPPQPVGTRSVPGLLTPPLGQPLGTGRFFAKLTRVDRTLTLAELRRGDSPFRGADFPLATWLPSLLFGRLTPTGYSPVLAVAAPFGEGLVDGEEREVTYWVLRVVGVQPLGPQGGASGHRNAVAVLEAFLGRDQSLALGGAMAVLGPDNSSNFSGNSFDLEGGERPGITFLYDNPGGGDAHDSLLSTYHALRPNQHDNVRGAEGPFGAIPSLRDDTEAVRNDPERKRILDPNFLARLLQGVSRIADLHYPGPSTHLAGGRVQLGTPEEPKIVYVEGDLQLSGSGSGCGLLVVTGHLEYDGAFDYEGLVIVAGAGSLRFAGANKTLTGGLLLARLEASGGAYVYGNPSLDFRGNSNLIYSEEAVRKALNLLPLHTWSWREITPEVEPVE